MLNGIIVIRGRKVAPIYIWRLLQATDQLEKQEMRYMTLGTERCQIHFTIKTYRIQNHTVQCMRDKRLLE